MNVLEFLKSHNINENNVENVINQMNNIHKEATIVRKNDSGIIEGMFGNFYDKQLKVGIGFKRAFGAILSGDYFELFKLEDGNYLFVFADLTGHGLPAYTSMIRLRCAILLAIRDYEEDLKQNKKASPDDVIRKAGTNFTDIMDVSGSQDFASIIFTYISNFQDKYNLKFYNRGMYFPVILRKYNNQPVDIYNLNYEEKGWVPHKGGLLSSELRMIQPDEYNKYPSAEFTICEGDCLLYFTDGIIEAKNKKDENNIFGMKRLREILTDNSTLLPQMVINILFDYLYDFMGDPKNQDDDMTAVYIDFPKVNS